jgi:hypothetical protein
MAIKFLVEEHEHDINEIIESILTLRGLGAVTISSKMFHGDDAQSIAEQFFVGPALDMKGTFIGGMITAQIQLRFKDGDTVNFDIYNDRLALDRTSETAYYINSSFHSMKDTI